ncbi:MAG: sulfur carrier protein ThiS [Xanthomonadaceae bacterium]|nr:sulfur carrier protein ThiS [Xanthomonadaceae bacterium]MDP2184848.1 sulfur carrier protein ThiS [Xanthomonadales bacterium]MDZ4115062.1 sulfur carrier protein ThiS [Xanthomonadaceae bacterium]MDZ4378122.1 sulfur carrier protein ThiS [Xanthomonadaceae bacterium]
MEIELNGKATTVPEGITINALLIDIGLGERRVAVEVNREVVPRSQHLEYRLNDSDRVEIVHAIGGG